MQLKKQCIFVFIYLSIKARTTWYINMYIFTIVFDILKKCNNIADERVFLTEKKLDFFPVMIKPKFLIEIGGIQCKEDWESLRCTTLDR